MAEKDKHLTAFSSHLGLHQFRVMPFGLSNAPSCFERMMERVIQGMQFEKCLCYLDDVIVFGKTFEETFQNLQNVFQRFRDANLKLKPKKCHLFQKEIEYLGHMVSENGVTCSPRKTKAVQEWPIPESKSDIRSFLGLVN